MSYRINRRQKLGFHREDVPVKHIVDMKPGPLTDSAKYGEGMRWGVGRKVSGRERLKGRYKRDSDGERWRELSRD
jgi:hypothetical protein